MITQHEDQAEQIHGLYRWRTFGDTTIIDGTLQEAANALGLDPNEVAWACEEYGRCDTEYGPVGLVAWQPGPIQFTPEGEPFAGGYEWPATEAPTEENDQ